MPRSRSPPLIFGVLLFGPAGTLSWRRAWIFLGAIALASVVTTVTVFPGNQALIDERFKPPIQEGQPLRSRPRLLGRHPLPRHSTDLPNTQVVLRG